MKILVCLPGRETPFAGEILPQKIVAKRSEGTSLSEALRQYMLA